MFEHPEELVPILVNPAPSAGFGGDVEDLLMQYLPIMEERAIPR